MNSNCIQTQKNDRFYSKDGGDCNQLCDYDKCNVTCGECINGCNTTECDYGFDNQCIDNNYLNSQCNPISDFNSSFNNYTLCLNNTYCYSNAYWNEEIWIGDEICDDVCNVDICDYDLGDCDQCVSNELCDLYWQLFVTYSNSVDADYLLSLNEFCQLYPILDAYIQSQSEDKWNCTTLLHRFDIDKNEHLNAYETMVGGWRYDEGISDFTRSLQINCSLCASNVLEYYTPWNWDQIRFYTNFSIWLDK